MSLLHDILDANGVDLGAPQWVVVSTEFVPPEQFGKDHYSALLYVESRAVDYQGMLDHRHMRCHHMRHPILGQMGKYNAETGTYYAGMGAGLHDGAKYATRLRRVNDQTVELPNHDDYDCLDDLVAAGMLQMTMPQAKNGKFVDAYGRTAKNPEGENLDPRFYTGMDEQILGGYANWSPTDYGFTVAAALRKHQARSGTVSTFECPTPTDPAPDSDEDQS